MPQFKVVSDFDVIGDQAHAIETLSEGVLAGKERQTLMGVTGSGKTFTMAKIIEQVQKPPSCTGSSRPSSRTTRSSILFPTMITISRRHMSLRRILILRKIRISTMRSTNSATRRRRLSRSAAMSSSSLRSPVSTGSVLRSITRIRSCLCVPA